jgi:membrane protein DedA with SNARE-associated domain
VLHFVAIESTGIPFPGETMLLVAVIYAGTTHRLAIPLVIAAAAHGAVVGDNLGYWIGREGGYRATSDAWRRPSTPFLVHSIRLHL